MTTNLDNPLNISPVSIEQGNQESSGAATEKDLTPRMEHKKAKVAQRAVDKASHLDPSTSTETVENLTPEQVDTASVSSYRETPTVQVEPQFTQDDYENDSRLLRSLDYNLTAYATNPHRKLYGRPSADLYRNLQGQEVAKIDAANAEDRSVVTDITDAAKSFTKGVVDLGAAIPALTFYISNKFEGDFSQDLARNALSVFQTFQGVSQGINESQSLEMQRQQELLSRTVDKTRLQNEFDRYLKGTEDSKLQIAADFLEETGVALEEAITNPLIMMDLVGSEVIPLIASAGIGSIAAKATTGAVKKGVTANATKRAGVEASTEAVDRLAQQSLNRIGQAAGTTAGVVTSGLEAGSGVAGEALREVDALSIQDLENSSPRYSELIRENNTPEQAKEIIKQEVFDEVFEKGAITTALLSKLTGSASFTGNLFNSPKLTALAKAGSVPVNTVREGAQEGLEETVAGTLSNEVINRVADENKGILDGVAESAGLGIAGGSAAGGGVSIPRSVAGIVQTVDEFTNGSNAETITEAPQQVTPEEINNIVDVDVELKSKFEGKSLQEIGQQLNQIVATAEELRGKDILTKEEESQLVQAELDIEVAKQVISSTLLAEGKANPLTEDEFNDGIKSEDSEVREDTRKRTIFNSSIDPDSVTNEQLELILEDPETSKDDKDYVEAALQTRVISSNIAGSTGKSVGQVAANVTVKGTDGKISLPEHRQAISKAIASGSQDLIIGSIARLRKFADSHSNKAARLSEAVSFLENAPDNTLISQLNLTQAQSDALDSVDDIFSYKGNFSGSATVGKLKNLSNTVSAESGLVSATLGEMVLAFRDNSVSTKAISSKKARKVLLRREAAAQLTEVKEPILPNTRQGANINRKFVNSLTNTLSGRDFANAVEFSFGSFVNSQDEVTDEDLGLINNIISGVAELRDENATVFTQEDVQALKNEGKDSIKKRLDKSNKGASQQQRASIQQAQESQQQDVDTTNQVNEEEQTEAFNEVEVESTTSVQEDSSVNQSDEIEDSTPSEEVIEELENNNTAETENIKSGLFGDRFSKVEEELDNERIDDTSDIVASFYSLDFTNPEKASILHTVPNLLNLSTKEAFNSISNKLGRELSAKEVKGLNQLFSMAKKIREGISEEWGELPEKNKEFSFRHPIYSLRNGSKFDHAIIDSLALSGAIYYAQSVTTLIYSDSEQVATFLTGEDTTLVDSRISNFVSSKGVPGEMIYDSLGSTALKALGLRVNKKAMASLDPKFKNNLGNMLVNSLVTSGFLTSETLKPEDLYDVKGVDKEISKPYVDFLTEALGDGSEFTSYRPPVVKGKYLDTLPEELNNTTESINKIASTTSSVFNTDTDRKDVLWEKPTLKDISKKVSKSIQKVSPQQLRALLKKVQTPNSMKVDHVNLLQLSREQIRDWLGYQTDQQIDLAHVDNRDSLKGKNLNIDSDVNAYFNQLDELSEKGGLNTPFYFMHNVWKQLRMGMQSNGINPQQSAFIRHFVGTVSNNTQKFSIQPNSVVPTADERNLLLSIAIGFDISVDKKHPDVAIQQLFDILDSSENPEIASDIQSLLSMIREESIGENPEEFIRLSKKVTKALGSEPAALFDSLVNLNRYLNAKVQASQSKKPVEIIGDIFYEVDGVSNGPWITMEQLGSFVSKLTTQTELAKGGLSFSDNEQSYPDLITTGKVKTDFYATYATVALEQLLDRVTPKTAQVFNAFSYFLPGVFVSGTNGITEINSDKVRSSGKTLLVPANYAAGTTSQAKALMEEVIANIREDIEKTFKELMDAVDANDKQAQIASVNKMRSIVDNAKILINSNELNKASNYLARIENENNLDKIVQRLFGNVSGVPAIVDISLLQESSQSSTLKVLIKESVDEALLLTQAPAKAHRDLINLNGKILVTAYVKLLEKAVEAKKKELEEAHSFKGLAQYLTNQDMEEIQASVSKVAPVFNTLFSSINNDLTQAVWIAKTKKVKTTEGQYRASYFNKEGKEKASNSTIREITNGGVAPTVGSIISIDSTIATVMYQIFEGLGLHDAYAFNAKDISKGAEQDYNQITYEVLSNIDTLQMVTSRTSEVLQEASKELGIDDTPELLTEIGMDSLSILRYFASLSNNSEIYQRLSESSLKLLARASTALNAYNQEKNVNNKEEILESIKDELFSNIQVLSKELADVNTRLRKENGLLSTEASFLSQYSGGQQGYDVRTHSNNKFVSTEALTSDDVEDEQGAIKQTNIVTPTSISKNKEILNELFSKEFKFTKEILNDLLNLKQDSLTQEEKDLIALYDANITTSLRKIISNKLNSGISDTELGLLRSLRSNALDLSLEVEFKRSSNPSYDDDINQEIEELLSSKEVHSSDSIDKLFNLFKKSSNHNYVLVASKLKELLDSRNVTINIINSISQLDQISKKDKSNAASTRQNQDGSITIFVKSNNFFADGFKSNILIRELVHAVSSDILRKDNSELNPIQLRGKKELNELFKRLQPIAKDLSNFNLFENAFLNEREFLVEALTNKPFQIFLASQQATATRTAKSVFIDSLGKLLGFKKEEFNALEQAYAVLEDLNAFDDITAPNTFNSSKANTESQNRSDYSYREEVNSQNVLEVFDNIKDGDWNPASEAHSQHLREVLTDLVKDVIQPLKIFTKTTSKENRGYVDLNRNAIYMQLQGVAPNVNISTALSKMRMSRQEVLVHELLHAVLAHGIDNNYIAKRQLEELYLQVIESDQVNFEDFIYNPQGFSEGTDEYKALEDQARSIYDHVFSPKDAIKTKRRNTITGKEFEVLDSDHLHEFVTLALTHKPLMDKLKKINLNNTEDNSTIYSRLANLFRKVINKVHAFITKSQVSPANTVDEKILQIAKSILKAEERAKAIENSVIYKTADKIEDILDNASDSVTSGVSKIIKNLDTSASKLPTRLVELAERGGVAEFLSALDDIRLQTFEGKESFLGQMGSELVGRKAKNSPLINQFIRVSKNIEKVRSQISSGVKNSLNAMFANELSDEEKSALTKAVLKTDLVSVINLDNPDIAAELHKASKLLTDDAYLQTEIVKLNKQLNQFKDQKNFFSRAAESLGHFMVKGVPTEEQVLLNAHLIARQSYEGADPNLLLSEADANKAEIVINKLATLYALQYTPKYQKNIIASLIQSEKDSGKSANKNGVVFTLRVHAKFKKDSLRANLKGQKALAIKGYIRDLNNPHIDVVAAPKSKERELLGFGYVIGEKIERDSADNHTEELYIYKNPHGGKMPLVSGAFSLESNSARGTNTIEMNIQQGIQDPYTVAAADAQSISRAKARATQDMYLPRTVSSSSIGNTLVGVHDRYGRVSEYRYMMSEATKDTVLERDTTFDNVLGSMMSTVVAKPAGIKNNTEVTELLFNDYIANVGKSGTAKRYIKVSPDSNDPYIRNLWSSLPEEAHRDIRKVWGSNAIYVSKENFNILFGYRKFSMVNWAFGTPQEQNDMTKFMLRIFQDVLPWHKAPAHLKTVEDVLFEVTKFAKDNLIVKGLLITFDNYLSNITTLKISGVSWKDIITGHIESYTAAKDYQKTAKDLYSVELLLSTGTVTGKEKNKLENKAAALKVKLDSSPIAEMVEAGMLQTIVEDIEEDADNFAFRKKWIKQLEGKTERITRGIPEKVKVAGNGMLMRHGTASYEIANNLVHISDFSARYVLFKHLTSRKSNKLTPEQAFEYSMDLFVNYDIPTNRTLQWANDIGLVWFTKYLLRNQRAILMLINDNPGRAALYTLFQNIVMPTNDIMDTVLGFDTIMNRFNVPGFGALNTIGDIPVINAASSIT